MKTAQLHYFVGTDEYGEHIHQCMYHDLWVNSPKESIEYPDYTYEEHFGKPLPSYPPRAAVRDYIEGKSIPDSSNTRISLSTFSYERI